MLYINTSIIIVSRMIVQPQNLKIVKSILTSCAVTHLPFPPILDTVELDPPPSEAEQPLQEVRDNG